MPLSVRLLLLVSSAPYDREFPPTPPKNLPLVLLLLPLLLLVVLPVGGGEKVDRAALLAVIDEVRELVGGSLLCQ